MKKLPYPGMLAGLWLAFVCVACSPLVTQESPLETETPVATILPSETATLVLLPAASPTETSTPEPPLALTTVNATATSQFPPVCERSVASTLAAPLCQRPVVEQSSTFCENKVPYNLIFIDQGASYEVTGDGIVCSDAGVKDGKQMVICSGLMGTSFELKICGQQTCTPPTPSAEGLECRPGSWYDQAQGCCAFIPESVEQSCVTLRLQTPKCTINCAEFTKADPCNNHYPSCQWNDEDSVCQVRK